MTDVETLLFSLLRAALTGSNFCETVTDDMWRSCMQRSGANRLLA